MVYQVLVPLILCLMMEKHNLKEVALEDDEPAMTPDQLRKQFEVVLDHKVPVFVAGLGDPSWVVPLARDQGMKVGGMVGAPRHALPHNKQEPPNIRHLTSLSGLRGLGIVPAYIVESLGLTWRQT